MGVKAEKGNIESAATFIFEDKELLDTLYEGLVMNGAPYDTVVEGFYSATDNATNEPSAVLYRKADGMELIFLADKGVRDHESKILLTKISYYDFDENRKFSFAERYDDSENPIYFIYIDDDTGRTVNYQITEQEARRGLAALSALPLEDDINAKANAFLNFSVEVGAIKADVASTLLPDAVKASEPGSFIFDEAYISGIFNGFVKDGENQVDGFISESGVSKGDRNILARTSNDDIYLEIQTDEDIADPKSKITQVLLYGVAVETNEYYGFAQKYSYDRQGNKTANNIIFVGPLGSTQVVGNDGLGDDDFKSGVTMLMDAHPDNRREIFDEFFEEMDQKYDPTARSY